MFSSPGALLSASATDNTNGPKIPVILAGRDLSDWIRLRRGLTRDGNLMLVHCPESPPHILAHCSRLAPCVVIVREAVCDEIDPLELAKMADFGRSVRVLVRMESDDPEKIKALLRLGCVGFLGLDESVRRLANAVKAVSRGELWAGRGLISDLLLRFLSADSTQKLTRREAQILELLGRGYTNQQISSELFITRETVRWHLRTLYAKLGVHDRVGAVAHAGELSEHRTQMREESVSATVEHKVS